MKRVVITGIGLVSCIGNNQEEVYQSLINWKSGSTFCDEHKEYNLKSNIHGKPNIKLEDFIDRKIVNLIKNQGISTTINWFISCLYLNKFIKTFKNTHKAFG